MSAATPQEMVSAWEQMISAGDIEGVLGFYPPDAVAVLPKDQGGPARGRDAVRQVLDQFLALKPTFEIVLNRSTEAGEVALIVGDWRLQGTDPDGNPLTMDGRFRDVLHRQPDGTWLIAIDNPFGDD